MDLGEHGWSLSLECGRLPVDGLVEEKGLIPNGYFWTSVVEYLAENDPAELLDGVILDPEANAFFAGSNDRQALVPIQTLLDSLASDAAALSEVFGRASAVGFVFDG